MDLRERHQLDVAAAMHRVRSKARPWRSFAALLIAIAGAIAARYWGTRTLAGFVGWQGHHSDKLIFILGFAAFVVFGLAAAVGLSGSARSALQPVVGQAHAGVVRYVLVLVGVFTYLAIGLHLVGVPTSQLLVGGAVGGVLLGIAAQQSLSNLFAGLVLLFARPFRVGDHVRFRAGALSGQIDGFVTDVSLTYVRLDTAEGLILLPNSQALASAVMLVADPPGGSTSLTPPPAVTSAPLTAPAVPAGPGVWPAPAASGAADSPASSAAGGAPGGAAPGTTRP